MKKKLDIVAGDLVLFPTDPKFNFKEQYGLVLEVMQDYFTEPRDEEEGLDDGEAYRVEWMKNDGETEYSIEDYPEIAAFRKAFLKKHPDQK